MGEASDNQFSNYYNEFSGCYFSVRLEYEKQINTVSVVSLCPLKNQWYFILPCDNNASRSEDNRIIIACPNIKGTLIFHPHVLRPKLCHANETIQNSSEIRDGRLSHLRSLELCQRCSDRSVLKVTQNFFVTVKNVVISSTLDPISFSPSFNHFKKHIFVVIRTTSAISF